MYLGTGLNPIEQLSQQSNSLFPFQLKEVLAAERTPPAAALGGGGGVVTHALRLRLAQGSQPDEVFEVEVEVDSQGHRLKSSKVLRAAPAAGGG